MDSSEKDIVSLSMFCQLVSEDAQKLGLEIYQPQRAAHLLLDW